MMMSWPDARYTATPVAEYTGNPFIECLPPIMSDEHFIKSMTVYPAFQAEERELPKEVRRHLIKRLDTFRVPTVEIVAAHQKLDVELRHGYVDRDPKLVAARRSMYGQLEVTRRERAATPNCQLITGLSGGGKSTLLESILAVYPQVVMHHDITPGISREPQLVWLKVDCPQDAGLRGLCMAILEHIDELLGTSYLYEWGHSRCSVEGFLQAIYRITNNLHLGVLVLDELQHLRSAKAGGQEKMLNFFVNLINGVGLPLVFAGTYALEGIVTQQLRNARRATGVGTVTLPRLRLNDPMWRLFTRTLWRYQWITKPAPLDSVMEETFYDCTQGIRDCGVRLFAAAQNRAIDDGSECITVTTLRETYDKAFKPLHEAHQLLRSGRPDDDPIFDSLLSKNENQPHGWRATADGITAPSISAPATSNARMGRPIDPKKCDRESTFPILDARQEMQPFDLRRVEGDVYEAIASEGLIDKGVATILPLPKRRQHG